MSERPLRVVELFCGVGGAAAALGSRAHVVAAVDQNRRTLDVYAANFPHPTLPLSVESIAPPRWRAWNADLWWMSPPCPPYTQRGRQRDDQDPRARGLLAVIERIASARPRYLALENVPGFSGSRVHASLRAVLDRCGYEVRETLLCPTELGLPNRRQRFYLVAGRQPLADWPPRSGPRHRLAALLDEAPAPALWCEPDLASRYRRALDIVDPADPSARAACFTSAYGRSLVRSGSYLVTPTGLRRFSPTEILRLLDFPEGYRLPPELTLRLAWKLTGNSVSVRAVRWVLAAIPELGPVDAAHRTRSSSHHASC